VNVLASWKESSILAQRKYTVGTNRSMQIWIYTFSPLIFESVIFRRSEKHVISDVFCFFHYLFKTKGSLTCFTFHISILCPVIYANKRWTTISSRWS
jgi:hypothetical protein